MDRRLMNVLLAGQMKILMMKPLVCTKTTTKKTYATAAAVGSRLRWASNSMKMILENAAGASGGSTVTTTGIGARAGMPGIGGGRGHLMLFPVVWSATTLLKRMLMPSGIGMVVSCFRCCSTTTPGSASQYSTFSCCCTTSSSSSRSPPSSAAAYHQDDGQSSSVPRPTKQGYSFLPVRARRQEVFLHKRQARSESRVKCCFASPASERTAFACCTTLEKSCPEKKSSLSTSPANFKLSSFRKFCGFYGSATFKGTNNSFGFIQQRTFITSSLLLSSDNSKMAQPNGSLARQNFHEDCEANINKQINMELYASYVYMSMAYYFDREDVALPGFSKFFKKASDEEREHAEKFMKYQNIRGGRIVLQPIAKPTNDEWASPLDAVSAALELEKTVNQTLLDLHGIAGTRNDPQLCDFLESNFLEEQVHAIKELSEYVARLKRVGPGLGEHIFDQELLAKE